MGSERFCPIRLSAFSGQRNWGIEDMSRNGDNLLRDWRYKASKRIWRATEEEARHVARELCEHPEILERDTKARARTGKTGAILNRQRAQRTRAHARVAPTFTRCDACGAMYRGDHTCTR